MLNFKKYPSIENSYRQKFIDKIIVEGLEGNAWIVQEKIHGANFAIYVDGYGDVIAASRNKFLNEQDKFYNYRELLAKYQESTEVIADLFSEGCILYGEIFGGGYQHKDVSPVKGAIKVQKGVCYCPQNELIVYDIWYAESFLSTIKVANACRRANLPYAQALFRGSLSDCLDYPNQFLSTIPRTFELPEIADNICEGVVIKPVRAKYLSNSYISTRIILKSKNSYFSEKSKEKKLSNTLLPENIKKIVNHLSQYVTDNKLRNVLSHFGCVTNKDFGKILGEFNKDIFKDYFADNNDLDNLTKPNKKKIQKLVNHKSASLIKSNFIDIVDGEYR